jgi:hypothetical protein
MEDPPVQPKKNAEHEHTRACKAQSLAHKLALFIETNGQRDRLPKEIRDRVDATRRELLSHKREELEEDLRKLERDITTAMNSVGTIKKLGGSPNKDLLTSIERLRTEKERIQKITDAELLGK